MLRLASEVTGVVALEGAFNLMGHYCLVLERLHPSLLDVLVDLASAPPSSSLPLIRKIGRQLLVRA